MRKRVTLKRKLEFVKAVEKKYNGYHLRYGIEKIGVTNDGDLYDVFIKETSYGSKSFQIGDDNLEKPYAISVSFKSIEDAQEFLDKE